MAWESQFISLPPQEQVRDHQTRWIECFYLDFSNLTASHRNPAKAELLASPQSLFSISDTIHFFLHPPQRDFTFEGRSASQAALMVLLLSSAAVG